ncbi:UbiX family flavin prenyltransferase [Vulcanisaeta sp. JCM 14467]|uniref:UbiX family flavin prenyltransferase n=1 Tax=Vulcanisaeta sp. JCM 14467 TaxID=1295370 RepID=UPI0006D268AF|nr:UbiX family flavin prenyltransferase [Vulcanisaeta sp. JCM 14467]
MRRIIVGITGASGVIYGVRFLEMVKRYAGDSEVHLVVSNTAIDILRYETELDKGSLLKLADKVYTEDELGAPIASGSFKHDGMVVIPCSMKTLASIAHGITDNLITRAADVTLKERRRLILVIRETPLNLIHIKNMELVTLAGAIVMPAAPAFYNRPRTIDDMVNFIVGRVLDLLGIENDLYRRWSGYTEE